VYWSLVYQLIFILGLVTFAICGEVMLQWDANVPTPDGYKLFQTTDGIPFDYDNPLWEGSEVTATVTVPEDVLHIFCVRAFTGNVVSGDSNWVYYIDETQEPPVFYQARPKNVRMIFEE